MSSDLGAVGGIDGPTWRKVLGLAADEHPVAIVVEGSWWRAERVRRRLGRLEASRELGVPDLFAGSWQGRTLLYACPYGAPRTAEDVHIAARIGVKAAIQVGSCGIVAAGIRPGDVVVPTEARASDGTAHHYLADDDTARSSLRWSAEAAARSEARGIATHLGPSVSWPTLFNQPLELVREWRLAGLLGVDMETATTLAVAERFGIAGVSMLVAWDELLSGRTFLDPLPEDRAMAFERADEAVFDVALELVADMPLDG